MPRKGLHRLYYMDNRIWMLVPLSLLFLLSQFYRASSAVIASELMHDLSLTAVNLGFLSSVFFYAFALIQIPMGAAMDLFGAKRLILGLSFLGIIGAVTFALAGSFPVAVLGRALLGVGMACALMGTFKLLTIWFPPDTFATISGLFLSIGSLGNIGATAPLAMAVDWMGWRKTFLMIALFQLLITIWIYLVVQDRPKRDQQGEVSPTHPLRLWRQSLEGIGQVIGLPSFWLIALAAFIRYGTYISIAGLWAGPYLESVYHLPMIDRGKLLMAFPIGFIVGSPIIGVLSDRVFKSRKWVVVGALSLYGVFILPMIGFLPHLSLTLMVAIFFGIGFFIAFNPLLYANIKELLPSSLSGTAMSAVNFFTMMGAAFFQHSMGAIIDSLSTPQGQLTAGSFSFAFGFCFVAAALGTVAYLFVKEIRP
ncbi:MAG: MFS transporter [Deltaproteobacteria bacterium]|nr:MAG: MFS transporter [Deltaproteobacteria bacterium]